MKRLFIPKSVTSSYTYFKLMDEEMRKVKSEGLVLDVGARSSHYKKQFKNYLSLDAVPFKGIDVVGDAHDLPFEKDSFQNVLLLGVLEYTWDLQKVIDEAYRVLKPGGGLIATVPFLMPYHPFSKEMEDYWRYTPGSIRKLLSKFSKRRIKNKGSLFSIISIYYENLLLKFYLTLFYPFVLVFHILDKIFRYKNIAVFYFVEAIK